MKEGPSGSGDQVVDPKPPRAAVVKSHGRERRGKVETLISAGMIERGELVPQEGSPRGFDIA